MKSLRLLALAMLICACTASATLACDASKAATSATTASAVKSSGKASATPASGCTAQASDLKTAANGAHSGCTAEMAAQCTPAMRAACEKNAAVAAAMGCTMKGTTSATAASMTGKGSCASHGTSATTAAMPKGARCDLAKAANASGDGTCKMHGSATAAGMDHCARAKGADATTAVAGMRCSAHMKEVAHECSACQDWASCEQDVRSLGAKSQVVALKNGAMIVYTADSQASIKALQSVVSKRNEKMIAALSAGSDKQLCDECKQLRGAMASGKLHREVVNVERGCMTLITSNDRDVVQKIRTMTGQSVAMR